MRSIVLVLILLCGADLLLAQAPELTAPSKSVGSVPSQSTQQSAQPVANLTKAGEQVVPNPFQIKEVESRVGLLENERTWVIGLTAGLGIGIALIVWLRKDIVRTLVREAFPSMTESAFGSPAPERRWYPNRAQWVVTWIATTMISLLLVFLPWSFGLSLRLAVVTTANAVLFLVFFSQQR